MRALIAASILLSSGLVVAASASDSKEQPKIAATASIAEQLMAARGQRVLLYLRAGKDIEGTVGNVAKEVVELKSLVGRDFFDGVVRIDDISAVIYRVKN